MKATAFCVGLGISLISLGQGTWTDSFSDLSLGRNPTWTGDTSFFTHSPNLELQLSDSVAGTRTLQTSSEAILNTTWRGKLRMEFNPSSSNYAVVQLATDTMGNAIRLQFGGQADDLIQLIAVRNGNHRSIISTGSDFLDLPQCDLEWIVNHDSNHVWTLQIDLNQSGMITIGQKVDSIVFPSTTYGLECHFTKTRSNKFFWDDLSTTGIPYVDSLSPTVLDHEWLNRKEFTIRFSEAIFSFPGFITDQFGTVWSLSMVNDYQFKFTSNTTNEDGHYTFNLKSFKDGQGNEAGTFSAKLLRPKYGDLVVNELMIDPTPPVHYPFEYIELKNESSNTIDLENLFIRINGTQRTLQDFSLKSNRRMVLLQDTQALMSHVIKAALPGLSLNNQHGTIRITDDWGEVLYRIEYSSQWHNSEWRANGGWSLSRNENMPSCSRDRAWSTSSSEFGGTPGARNSPLPKEFVSLNDLEFIELTDSHYVFHFTEPLKELAVSSFGTEVYVEPLNEENIAWKIESNSNLNLKLSGKTCSGRDLDTSDIVITETVSPKFGSLRITELLTSPGNRNAEFLEIVNMTDSCIDLSKIRMGRWSELYGIEELHAIVDLPTLIQGKEILLLSDEPGKVVRFYREKNQRSILTPSYLPDLPEKGGLALSTENGTLIDALEWSPEDHHPILSSTTDVSLERVGFSLGKGVLQSSSSKNGHGSPGIYSQTHWIHTDEIEAESFRFSPNNDGFEDLLILYLPSNWENGVLRMIVRNASGQKVAEPLEYYLVGKDDRILWNGTDDQGKILPSGQYLIEIEVIPLTQTKRMWRHGCLLTDG